MSAHFLTANNIQAIIVLLKFHLLQMGQQWITFP
jgi:hypothetical protein